MRQGLVHPFVGPRHGPVLLLVFGALFASPPPAFANTYVPTKFNDNPHHGLTLREAITKANKHSGHDTIVLQGHKTYDLSIPNAAGDENLSKTGDLDILDPLKITSSSHKLATVDGNGIDRVFQVGAVVPVSATFNRLDIHGGKTVGGGFDHGGGILSEAGGTVKILRSRIVGNESVGGGGGGVYADNRLTVNRSTLIGNSAHDFGGGIYALGATSIKASTISGNFAAGNAGGIWQQAGSLNATNSTFASNDTNGTGGGIDSVTSTTLSSVTVVRNGANADNSGGEDGGGLYTSASFIVRNSIIALNTVGTGSSGPDCYDADSPFTPKGVSLLTSFADCASMGSPPNILTSNPKLGSLKNNGGPTKTIALLKHSKAINHAGSGSPKRDQRGVKRNNPDIGAFERT